MCFISLCISLFLSGFNYSKISNSCEIFAKSYAVEITINQKDMKNNNTK